MSEPLVKYTLASFPHKTYIDNNLLSALESKSHFDAGMAAKVLEEQGPGRAVPVVNYTLGRPTMTADGTPEKAVPFHDGTSGLQETLPDSDHGGFVPPNDPWESVGGPATGGGVGGPSTGGGGGPDFSWNQGHTEQSPASDGVSLAGLMPVGRTGSICDHLASQSNESPRNVNPISPAPDPSLAAKVEDCIIPGLHTDRNSGLMFSSTSAQDHRLSAAPSCEGLAVMSKH